MAISISIRGEGWGAVMCILTIWLSDVLSSHLSVRTIVHLSLVLKCLQINQIYKKKKLRTPKQRMRAQPSEWTQAHTQTYTSTHTYTHTNIHIYTHQHTRTHKHLYSNIYTHKHIYTCRCTHTQIHIQAHRLQNSIMDVDFIFFLFLTFKLHPHLGENTHMLPCAACLPLTGASGPRSPSHISFH